MRKITKRTKTPYQTPKLRVYGDLRKLTQGSLKTREEVGHGSAAKTKAGSG